MGPRSLVIESVQQKVASTLSRYRAQRANLPSAILLALCIALGICGCGQSSGALPASGLPPQLKVVSVTDLGTLPTNPDILGRDGAFSAVFQGKVVWLYGDTFLANAEAQNRTLISDSWSFTSDLNAQHGISGFHERLDSVGAPTMILQETPDEQAFNQAHNSNNCQADPCGARWALWPMSIVVDPETNIAMIFYDVVSALPGDFNFQGVGSSVAIWQDSQQLPQRPTFRLPIVTDHRDLMFNEKEPTFGSTGFISKGILYIYGCGTPNDGSDKGCRLAKVAPASVQDRTAWAFYAGNGNWSSTLGDATSVFSGDDILSVSWNAYLQKYLAVYSQVFSQRVMMRTSANPEGPWSDESTAFTAMAPTHGNVYDAHAHPEYDINGGQTIFVTYSRSTSRLSSEVRLVAITFQASSS